MSIVEDFYLSKVVLVLASFDGVNNILELSENKRYGFLPLNYDAAASWMGGQSIEELHPPFLRLTIAEHLFDPQGWVLGSDGDSDKCDIQVAKDNTTGISRRFIRFDISPSTHCPRVTLLSDKKVRILDGDRVLTLKQNQPTEFSRPIVVDMGAIRFRAWPPKRTASEKKEYKKAATVFSEDMLRAVPKYIPSIRSQPQTLTHNTRYGKGGAVYVNERPGWDSRGAHASVIMVTDRTTGRIFGAKEPYYKLSDNHDLARKRFEDLQKEHEHIQKLDHPHILKAYDLVLAEDITLPPWMIVEYIPKNLSEALGDLTEHHKVTVLAQLSSALQYMHAQGMTHRDVKPDNILVETRDEDITVKLADFGTSKYNATEKMNTLVGTPIYLAPELFKKSRNYTDKVDLWSLGLIGMRLFTTWDANLDENWNPSDFGTWMRNVILPHIAEAPDQFRPFLKGLLRKSPRERWSARKCSRWLWKHSQTGEITHSNQRPVPALYDDLLKIDEDQRGQRSPNPSLSTARAHALQAAEQHFEQGSTLPDTLCPGAWTLESFPAPTPRLDDETSDDRETEAEEMSSSGSDIEYDDWKEHDSDITEGPETIRYL